MQNCTSNGVAFLLKGISNFLLNIYPSLLATFFSEAKQVRMKNISPNDSPRAS